MKRLLSLLLLIAFSALCMYIGASLQVRATKLAEESARVKDMDNCGMGRLGIFQRGDLLQIKRTFRGEHVTYWLLVPQKPSTIRRTGVVVRSSPAAAAELWQFDKVCEEAANLQVISRTSPDYDAAALLWVKQEPPADPDEVKTGGPGEPPK